MFPESFRGVLKMRTKLEHEDSKSKLNFWRHKDSNQQSVSHTVQQHISDKQIRTKSVDNFDFSSSTSTGGVTGSRRVKEGSSYYQLKPSILDNSYLRCIKAHSTDRENLGEFIAACIGQELLKSIDTQSEIPEVNLVYDQKRNRVLIASKYIGTNALNLDDYIKKQVPFDKAHASIIAGQNSTAGKIGFGSELMTPLKSSLVDAIAISAILGDHDINPGNMLVVADEHQHTPHVARIDLGHAFNDLLNAPGLFGGSVLNPEHPVLDFINREKIAGVGVNGGAPSKLWRDYPGVCSLDVMPELARSLAKIGRVDEAVIKKGIQHAKIEFSKLIMDMQENHYTQGIEHLQKSLIEINNNLSSEKITFKFNDLLGQLEQVFDNLALFTIKNCQDALYTANLITLQHTIRSLLVEGASISDVLDHVQSLPCFEALRIKADTELSWIKDNPSAPAFQGSVFQFTVRSKIQSLNELSNIPVTHAIAQKIINYIDGYKNDVRHQLIGQAKGQQNAEKLGLDLYQVGEALTNNDVKKAIEIVEHSRDEFIELLTGNKFNGGSSIIKSLNNIEFDLKKLRMTTFRDVVQGLRQSIVLPNEHSENNAKLS